MARGQAFILFVESDAMRAIPCLGAVVVSTMALSASLAAQRPVVRGSGAAMCALTRADFVAAGLQVNARPDASVQDDGQSAYCVYSGRSGATGGVELDVFWPAGGNPAAVVQTEQTVLGEDGAAYLPAGMAGVQDSRIATSIVAGGPRFAAIVVRRGDLVFTIALPAGPQARTRLLRLSRIVLARLT